MPQVAVAQLLGMGVCCIQALTDAGIDWQGDDVQQLDSLRCGVLIGTAMGGMTTFTTAVEDLTLKVCWSA